MNCPAPTVPRDGVAIEFPEYIDGTAKEAKNTVRRISLSEEDLPFGKVPAIHCGPLNWNRRRTPRGPTTHPLPAGVDAGTQGAISTESSTFAIRGIHFAVDAKDLVAVDAKDLAAS